MKCFGHFLSVSTGFQISIKVCQKSKHLEVHSRNEILASLSERLSGANFDPLPLDFLNLPPIPETVTVRKYSEGQISSSIKEEVEEEEEDEKVFGTVVNYPSKCSDPSILT